MQAKPQPQYTLAGDAPPLAYSIDTALRRLAIGRTKLYELIAAGELDTYTVGKRRFVSHSAIERFISRREAAEKNDGVAP